MVPMTLRTCLLETKQILDRTDCLLLLFNEISIRLLWTHILNVGVMITLVGELLFGVVLINVIFQVHVPLQKVVAVSNDFPILWFIAGLPIVDFNFVDFKGISRLVRAMIL